MRTPLLPEVGASLRLETSGRCMTAEAPSGRRSTAHEKLSACSRNDCRTPRKRAGSLSRKQFAIEIQQDLCHHDLQGRRGIEPAGAYSHRQLKVCLDWRNDGSPHSFASTPERKLGPGIREAGLGFSCIHRDEPKSLKACRTCVIRAISHQSSLRNTRPGTFLEMGPILERIWRKDFASDGDYGRGHCCTIEGNGTCSLCAEIHLPASEGFRREDSLRKLSKRGILSGCHAE